MKIVVVSAVSGELYFGLRMKKADPSRRHLRFSVVFSEENVGNFLTNDTGTFPRITEKFVCQDEIKIRFKGEQICSGGHRSQSWSPAAGTPTHLKAPSTVALTNLGAPAQGLVTQYKFLGPAGGPTA